MAFVEATRRRIRLRGAVAGAVVLAALVGAARGAEQGETVAEWTFDAGRDGWEARHQCELSAADGVLRVRSTGGDPFFATDVEEAPAGPFVLVIRMRSDRSDRGQVFWTTRKHKGTAEGRSRRFAVRDTDDGWATYRVTFETDTPLTGVRVDPGTQKGVYEIQRIRLRTGKLPKPEATPADAIKLPDGFTAERLYSVPRDEQGSWVSLSVGPEGRLVTSAQYGGLYRVTPPPVGSEKAAKVTPIDVGVGMAQGLCHAFGGLYAVVNGKAAEGPGLYRIDDTDDDERYDTAKLLRAIGMDRGPGVEHGPHSVVVGPKGESLYVVAGNMTAFPKGGPAKSRVPRHWGEDLLLPRMPDAARGHASSIMAPGGWVCRTDPKGEQWELVCSGFRNPYDIAFNRDGELFTYDADMELDIGLPWYRPTRVCHVVSGGEYGWRNGSGKWPPWYPDSLPSAVDIGVGSPTGITFAYEADFPARYREALFIGDWSYGKIYAVHLRPDGATYTGSYEQFATASPLPVTDIAVSAKDGAMYFLIGGRKTQSGLYRITYTGDVDASEGGSASEKETPPARKLRHKLAEYHEDVGKEAVDAAWGHLDHEDRFVRFAARIALEHQSPRHWRDRALTEEDADKKIRALLGLVRSVDGPSPRLRKKVISRLGEVSWGDLSTLDKLALLRLYALTWIRHEGPTEKNRRAVIDRLAGHYPSGSTRLDRELSRVLGYLEAPELAGKTVPRLFSAPTQKQQIHYAYVLRTVDRGWTLSLRRRFLEWFAKARRYSGGLSLSGYLRNMRKQFVEGLSERSRKKLEEALAKSQPKEKDPVLPQAQSFVEHWTVDDLLPSLRDGLENRSFERGRKIFSQALCFRCHRFDGKGGVVGPVLTGVGKRLAPKDLLRAIIKPNATVSDQYRPVLIERRDGTRVLGRIVNMKGKTLRVRTSALRPSDLTRVNRNNIESMERKKISPMPPNLLDAFKRDEVLDLLAYLLSAGDPTSPMFASNGASGGDGDSAGG